MEAPEQVPAAATAGAERTDLKPMSISRIGAWARCTAAAHLRYVEHAEIDYSAAHFVVGTTIHEALESYYKGEVRTPQIGAEMALRALFHSYGEDAAFQLCKRVVDTEDAILAKFRSGEITKADGTPYLAPRSTTAYKNAAKEAGIAGKLMKLKQVGLGNIQLPTEGVMEIYSRVTHLVDHYAKTIMVPREHFERVYVEELFDFVDITPEGREVRFLGYMDLVGKLKPEHGGGWRLIDYKSGKPKPDVEHQEAADTSPQLSLYEHVLTDKWGIPRADLHVALHYLDAGYEAATRRNGSEYQGLLDMADVYHGLIKAPVIARRLFYDSKECQECEYRSACVAKFGTKVCRESSVDAPVAPELPVSHECIW